MNRSLRSLALLGLLGLCAAAPRMPSPVADALAMKNRENGATFLESQVSGASEADAPWLLLHAAELRRLDGDTERARAIFQQVTERYPGSAAKDPAVVGLTVVDASSSPSGNTLATLSLIGDKGVPDTLNADRYLLLARSRLAEGASPGEIRSLSDKAVRYAADQKDVSRRVRSAVASLGDEPPVENLPSGPTDLAPIEAIRAAVAGGDLARAGELAADFSTQYADSPFAVEAGYAKRRAEKGVRADPKFAAVLLPLSGKYAIPGASLRAAIELGNHRAGDTLRLAFFDTGGSPEQCVKALEEATLEQGAGVVIGPLLREEALLCAPAAQAIRVPMITLTSSEEVLAAGDQIYRAFPSTEQQVEALLTETYDLRALHRYAILHPKTNYGENAARVFTDAVTARGGTVTARASYDAGAKDYRAVAQALGKKDYKARGSEFARLKRDAVEAKLNPDKVTLPPIIEYDAIFIPDSYQQVALIASALAFEEFPVGRFRPHREDTLIPLLGLSAWNNDELARRGGIYVQDSIFVDAFDPRAQSAATASFLDAWKERGSGDPTVVEASAYDTTRLLAQVARAGGDQVAALQSTRLVDPVAGTVGFDASRQMGRSWAILTVTKEGVGPLKPTEPTEPSDAGR